MYIGQSANVQQRTRGHTRDKIFDRVAIVGEYDTREEAIEKEIELLRRYLAKYKQLPCYNETDGVSPATMEAVSLAKARRRLKGN